MENRQSNKISQALPEDNIRKISDDSSDPSKRTPVHRQSQDSSDNEKGAYDALGPHIPKHHDGKAVYYIIDAAAFQKGNIMF